MNPVPLAATGCLPGDAVPIAGKNAHEPDIAIADDTVWLAWSERSRDGDAIRFTKLGEKHRTASTNRGIESQPCLLAASPDEAELFWISRRQDRWALMTRQIRGGNLGEEETLLQNEDGLFQPRVLRGPDGRVWLVCQQIRHRQPQLVQLVRDKKGWSDLHVVATVPAPCYRPCLSRGPENGIWLAYDAYRNNHYEVYLQRIDTPGLPVLATPNSYQNVHPALAYSPEGGIWLSWASNANAAKRDPWWLTKWSGLRYFDGDGFADPAAARPDVDIYNEDVFQGWEFPEVAVDAFGTVWVFGQAAHTLFAQRYSGDGWSNRQDIAPRRWGSWKPRVRAAGSQAMYLVSMGLQGAQLHTITPQKLPPATPVAPAIDTVPDARAVAQAPPDRPSLAVDGKNLQYYFGDLHAHSVYGDAAGDVDEFYHRYRDAYGYDFAALTEHDYLDGIELSRSELAMMWNHSDRMTEEGRFVAFYGYEWTSPALADHAGDGGTVGEGHRHVLYPDPGGPLVSYGDAEANTGAKLLTRLKGRRALVVPHHTAWSGTDWDAHDPELQRVVEICSAHGRFEHAGNLPIGYRRDHIHPGKFVHDALARGYRLGFVGGSDSHGLRWHGIELEGRAAHIAEGTRVGWKEDAYRTGMTVVLAPELTRESLFESLYRRRCYATSGVRIVLDFRVGNALMGEETTTHEQPVIQAIARGTAPIRSIEVVRSGHVFAGVQAQPGEGLNTVHFETTDRIIIPGESHYYYLRVLQEDGNMAWSSPIWVSFE